LDKKYILALLNEEATFFRPAASRDNTEMTDEASFKLPFSKEGLEKCRNNELLSQKIEIVSTDN
jgi:hypothetical protein